MKIEEKKILEFHDDYKPSNGNGPTNDGFYMTIRCGLSGIYSFPNEWKDGKWQMQVLDASTTIAYSKEEVIEWAREKMLGILPSLK